MEIFNSFDGSGAKEEEVSQSNGLNAPGSYVLVVNRMGGGCARVVWLRRGVDVVLGATNPSIT